MTKTLRPLLDITKDMEQEFSRHREAIEALQQEVSNFQDACPHPKELIKTSQREVHDEYGSTDYYVMTSECLACGAFACREVEQQAYKINNWAYPSIVTGENK